jgi:hypothetical protein
VRGVTIGDVDGHNGGVMHVRPEVEASGVPSSAARQRLADPLYALIVFWAGISFGIAAALLVIRIALGDPFF